MQGLPPIQGGSIVAIAAMGKDRQHAVGANAASVLKKVRKRTAEEEAEQRIRKQMRKAAKRQAAAAQAAPLPRQDGKMLDRDASLPTGTTNDAVTAAIRLLQGVGADLQQQAQVATSASVKRGLQVICALASRCVQ